MKRSKLTLLKFSWVLCCCNVGDSLCFVYNRNYGVREVTLGSHDIDQMRDMRDAGGALGPVDGRNPQLHNLTCSMTFVEAGKQENRVGCVHQLTYHFQETRCSSRRMASVIILILSSGSSA